MFLCEKSEDAYCSDWLVSWSMEKKSCSWGSGRGTYIGKNIELICVLPCQKLLSYQHVSSTHLLVHDREVLLIGGLEMKHLFHSCHNTLPSTWTILWKHLWLHCYSRSGTTHIAHCNLESLTPSIVRSLDIVLQKQSLYHATHVFADNRLRSSVGSKRVGTPAVTFGKYRGWSLMILWMLIAPSIDL